MFELACLVRILNSRGYTFHWISHPEMNASPLEIRKLKPDCTITVMIQHETDRELSNIKNIEIHNYMVKQIIVERVLASRTKVKYDEFLVCSDQEKPI